MNHSWVKPGVTSLLALAIFGLAGGVLFRSLWIGVGNPVSVEPDILEIAVDPLQYQAIPVHLQLKNRSHKTIQVRSADTSCGCASLVTRGGRPLIQPLDVPSGATVPWQVVVQTQGRIGPSEFKVFFEIDSGGSIHHAISTIKMNILPAIDINPSAIDFDQMTPNEERNATFQLSDAYPDSGYCVAKVTVSNPERIHVKIVPPEKSAPTDTSDANRVPATFRTRWCIKLRYLAPMSPRAFVRDEILLEPKDSLLPRITIPVMCRMKTPSYEIAPETLVLTEETLGQILKRTIRCHLHNGADSRLHVISAPSLAKVKIVVLEAQTAELQITLDVPRLVPKASTIKPIVIGSGLGSAEAFSIPIEFLGTN